MYIFLTLLCLFATTLTIKYIIDKYIIKKLINNLLFQYLFYVLFVLLISSIMGALLFYFFQINKLGIFNIIISSVGVIIPSYFFITLTCLLRLERECYLITILSIAFSFLYSNYLLDIMTETNCSLLYFVIKFLKS